MKEVNQLDEPSTITDQVEDAELLRSAARGDSRAFAAFIRRHEASLVSVIRRYIGDTQHAEDVLQETLLQAWLGVSGVSEPEKARAWLLRVARNRCLDHLKESGRRTEPVEAESLDTLASRHWLWLAPARDAAREVTGALEAVPALRGEVARLFYLDGFTIGEIAARYERPEGTVKRYLFEARDLVREALGMPQRERKEHSMSRHKKGAQSQPFPVRRPGITITPSKVPPFEVDCRELRWWFAVPEVGNRTMWAMYDPPDWKISNVTDMQAVRPARIHDLDGVEINVDEWEPGKGWTPSIWTMYTRLTEEAAEWLAAAHAGGGKLRFTSYLDEEFGVIWYNQPRRLADSGRYDLQRDGSFILAEGSRSEIGGGIFEVSIGAAEFTCLRVIDLFGDLAETGGLMEAYITQEGRTVIGRRYNGRTWNLEDYKTPWDERFPDNQQMVINGVKYVHWYDCLTGLGVGIRE